MTVTGLLLQYRSSPSRLIDRFLSLNFEKSYLFQLKLAITKFRTSHGLGFFLTNPFDVILTYFFEFDQDSNIHYRVYIPVHGSYVFLSFDPSKMFPDLSTKLHRNIDVFTKIS